VPWSRSLVSGPHGKGLRGGLALRTEETSHGGSARVWSTARWVRLIRTSRVQGRFSELAGEDRSGTNRPTRACNPVVSPCIPQQVRFLGRC